MTINEQLLTDSDVGKNVSNAVGHYLLPRFRWYGYKEGFSSQLVEKAINEVGITSDDYVLDPFNGSGTVTLTASINGYNSVGIEVNPFVAFMSKAKLETCSGAELDDNINSILLQAQSDCNSPLNIYSTFSEHSGKEKWLFNSSVLNSFESSWRYVNGLAETKKSVYQLALIAAAMDNCNAVKDGKCLKYRRNWEERGYNKASFISSLENRLQICKEDLDSQKILKKAVIINTDSRKGIKQLPNQYKLCVTSPPYLNSFDYTDIYRPELFLGKFIKSSSELKDLRFKTVRSHVEVKLPLPETDSFGEIYQKVYKEINDSEDIWSKRIPIMIQSYFEDMELVLKDLYEKALMGGELWLVVANSVYAGIEVPVDLILAEIGTKNLWHLKKIEVLRYINRRKTRYDGGINKVRESLIVFSKAQ